MDYETIVIGGGISGLSAAWHLKKRGEKVLVIEAAGRLGGSIGRIDDGPYPFVLGPRTIRMTEGGPLAMLIDEMGLSLLPQKKGLSRYIFHRGTLQPLQWNSPLLKGIRWPLVRGLCSPLKKKDLSMAAFFREHFSPEVAVRLGIPFLRGVFAQDGEELSRNEAFPWLTKGSLLKFFFRKRSQFVSLRGGIYSLIEKLQEKLDVSLNEKVLKIGVDYIETTKGKRQVRHVISTLPLHQLAPLIDLQVPKLPYQSVTSVHCYWSEKIESIKGFGYLVSPEEKGNVLGALFDSELQTAQGTAITVMLKGRQDGEEVWPALKHHLGLHVPPDHMKVTYASDAIPSYPVGFSLCKESFLNQLKFHYPSLTAIGTSFNGVSVPELIQGATSWKH